MIMELAESPLMVNKSKSLESSKNKKKSKWKRKMSDSPEMKVITEDLEAEINIVLKELNENP